MRVWIYARISSDQEKKGLGVARQLEDCREVSAAKGWTVAGEYTDNSISAFSGKLRPEYERLLGDVRAGAVDAVLVYSLERLTRQPGELEQFFDVCKAAGLRWLAIGDSVIDMLSEDGLLTTRNYGATAAHSSGKLSRRVKRKMRANAEAGLPHGGPQRPFGYEADKVTVRESEAAVVRQMVERFLAGESLRALATWMQDNGVATVAGQPWRTTTLRAMLSSARIAGLRDHLGVQVATATWPAIITEDQHRRVLALM